MMIMEVNGTAIQIKLEQNSSVDAIKELLRQGSITIEGLRPYGEVW